MDDILKNLEETFITEASEKDAFGQNYKLTLQSYSHNQKFTQKCFQFDTLSRVLKSLINFSRHYTNEETQKKDEQFFINVMNEQNILYRDIKKDIEKDLNDDLIALKFTIDKIAKRLQKNAPDKYDKIVSNIKSTQQKSAEIVLNMLKEL